MLKIKRVQDATPQRQLSGGGRGHQEALMDGVKKENDSVYSLGILAAFKRIDTQEEPAA